MEPRISIITLGVEDLDRSYEFYANGLGFPTTRNPEMDIIFFRTQGTCLALYPHDKLAEDTGGEFSSPDRSRFSGVTLAHNPRTREEVDEVYQLAINAGAKPVKQPEDAFWGGYSGYFSDPDGHLWEVAWGAFEFDEAGNLIIP